MKFTGMEEGRFYSFSCFLTRMAQMFRKSQLKSFRGIGPSKYKLTNTLNGSKNH